MSELPEGVDREATIVHAMAANVVGDLINRSARYLTAPEGSGEEDIALEKLEHALTAYTVDLTPDAVAHVLMMFTSLIVDVCEPKDVQAWFNHKAEMAKAVLDDGN